MEKDLDIIIFGATGFTGKHCIPVVNKFAKSNGLSLTWGIAGRSESKLKTVLEEYKSELDQDLSKVPLVIADVNDESSLKKMAARARIIINCCGPYRFYGEPVVKACISEGTHHVDVSGEPQYMESVQLKYHNMAKEKGIYIVSACGLDSIPIDLGIVFLQQNFAGTLNSVETYLEAWEEGISTTPSSSINYGTWESAVYGFATANELKGLRRQLYSSRMRTFSPRLHAKSLPHQTDIINGWALPFPGSDRSVARRSQRYFYEINKKRPVQVETYFVVKSLFHVFLVALLGLLFSLLARFQYGRKLLLDYPEVFSYGMFSRKPPSKEKIENTWFSLTLYGEGWKESLANADDKYETSPDHCILGRVKGRNPGYGATCLALVWAGITVITEKDKMPPGGGVYPPAAAFANTSIIDKLNNNGVTFEIISQKKL